MHGEKYPTKEEFFLKAGLKLLQYHIKEFYIKLSIRNKLISLYVFLVLIPAGILVYYFYRNTSITIKDEVAKSSFQVLKQADMNISFRLNSARKISNLVFGDSSLQNYLVREEAGTVYDHIQNTRALNDFIYSARNQGDVYAIKLFMEGKQVQPFDRSWLSELNEIKNTDWYKKTVEKNGALYWNCSYVKGLEDIGNSYVITCARVLRNPAKWESISGILAVYILEKDISDILREMELGAGQKIYVTDNEGVIVSHPDTTAIGQNIGDASITAFIENNHEGVFKTARNSVDTYVICKKIELTNWWIIAEIPSKEIFNKNAVGNTVSVTLVIIATLSLFMLTVVLLFSVIAEGVGRRIKQITKAMETSGVEFYSDNIRQADADIHKLELSVKGMISTVKRLVEESFQAKIREREAQFKALQAQINPHFLYNTLNSIKLMATLQGARGIENMVVALGRILKAALSGVDERISLRDELAILEDYIYIQKIRRKGKLKFEKNITDESLLDCQLIKFILQPIVENTIIHGIEPKDEFGIITVSVHQSDGTMSIEIWDNGVGMNDETIQIIQDTNDIRNTSSREQGIGLSNINQRIKLVYGEKYGLSFKSQVGVYTRVTVTIPVEYSGN